MKESSARRAEILFLILLTLGAFAARALHVGAVSLAEDEAAKWEAIQERQQSHFVGVICFLKRRPLPFRDVYVGGILSSQIYRFTSEPPRASHRRLPGHGTQGGAALIGLRSATYSAGDRDNWPSAS